MEHLELLQAYYEAGLLSLEDVCLYAGNPDLMKDWPPVFESYQLPK